MEVEQVLKEKGLKKTKVRIALLEHFIGLGHAQSYNDLQEALAEDIDKSTVYRNLSSFEKAGILHRIDDNTGITKYAFGGASASGENHAHFVCECCEAVYCMERQVASSLKMPEGFKATQIHTIVKGVCANC